MFTNDDGLMFMNDEWTGHKVSIGHVGQRRNLAWDNVLELPNIMPSHICLLMYICFS